MGRSLLIRLLINCMMICLFPIYLSARPPHYSERAQAYFYKPSLIDTGHVVKQDDKKGKNKEQKKNTDKKDVEKLPEIKQVPKARKLPKPVVIKPEIKIKPIKIIRPNIRKP